MVLTVRAKHRYRAHPGRLLITALIGAIVTSGAATVGWVLFPRPTTASTFASPGDSWAVRAAPVGVTAGLISRVGVRGRRLALPVGGSEGGDVEGWQVRSGGFGNRGNRGEHGDDGGGPRPRFWDLHASSSAASDQPGCHVKEAVAQCLGLAQGQDCGVARAGQHPRPGREVRGDHHRHEPGLIERELPRR